MTGAEATVTVGWKNPDRPYLVGLYPFKDTLSCVVCISPSLWMITAKKYNILVNIIYNRK